jgi:FkbM family methyltransferase
VKRFDQWYLPDTDTLLAAEMTKHDVRVDGRLTYQHHKYLAARSCCTQFRGAVDIGAHVGLWSYFMVQDFDSVDAFEPMLEHCQCLLTNVTSPKLTLHHVALGDYRGHVRMQQQPGHSGGTFVSQQDEGELVIMRPLDSYALTEVDLIKIDVEGYERPIIEGALSTILRERPVIIVEQVGNLSQRYGYPHTAVERLHELGYELVTTLGPDAILRWPVGS